MIFNPKTIEHLRGWLAAARLAGATDVAESLEAAIDGDADDVDVLTIAPFLSAMLKREGLVLPGRIAATKILDDIKTRYYVIEDDADTLIIAPRYADRSKVAVH